jgi:hypothetical protein
MSRALQPTADATPNAPDQAAVVRLHAMDFRSPPERLGRYLSYKAAQPAPTAPATSPVAAADDEEARQLYKWGERLCGALVETRERFGGDLDRYLIHMVCMLAEHGRRRRAAPSNAPGLNAFSLAEITGIPRETVRRKLRGMIEDGLIRRGGDGLYYPGPEASLERFHLDLRRLGVKAP